MPLIATETKVVVFSDFDGTITLNDSNGMYSLFQGVDWDANGQ
jgi:2-hydroxy-3-keto-5-methylthiopentenyl-1-phosphate phosphatase